MTPKHIHEYIKARPNSSIAVCRCGSFKFTKHAKGQTIRAVTAKKNPQPCEYCRLLSDKYLSSTGKREKRHVRARFKLHLKAVHKNPVTTKTVRAMKLAHRLAMGIFKATRNYKIPVPLPKRTPPIVKEYVQMILDANDIKWKV